jgi:oxysterol-binding protein 1
MEPGVAPTDSRLRPDIRAMEDGDWDQADKLMHSLEVKYIAKKKTEPIWFEMKTNPITNETFYHFKNDDDAQNYWECKKRSDWSRTQQSLFNYS